MANIQNELNNIKNALFGQEVRGSIHDGIDAINKEVESTTGRQVDLESTFNQLVINAGNSNAEIVDARVKADGTSYTKLGDRLDSFDSQLEHIANYSSDINNTINLDRYVSHRGLNWIYPENTIQAFQCAMECGFRTIETDILVTNDNIPVLMHDDTVDRTTDGTGYVKDMTLLEIKKLNINQIPFAQSGVIEGIKVPTLQEAIDFLKKNDMNAQFELKTNMDISKVVYITDIIKSNNYIDKCMIISFNKNLLLETRRLIPNVKIGLAIDSPTDDDYDFVIKNNVAYVTVNCDNFTKTHSDEFHKRGCKVSVWNYEQSRQDKLFDLEKELSLDVMLLDNLPGDNFNGIYNLETKTLSSLSEIKKFSRKFMTNVSSDNVSSNQFYFNDNDKSIHAVSDVGTSGAFDVKFDNLSVGDVVEIEFDILWMKGDKPIVKYFEVDDNYSFDGQNYSTSFVYKQPTTQGEWEHIKLSNIFMKKVHNNAFFYFGLETRSSGEYKIKNIKSRALRKSQVMPVLGFANINTATPSYDSFDVTEISVVKVIGSNNSELRNLSDGYKGQIVTFINEGATNSLTFKNVYNSVGNIRCPRDKDFVLNRSNNVCTLIYTGSYWKLYGVDRDETILNITAGNTYNNLDLTNIKAVFVGGSGVATVNSIVGGIQGKTVPFIINSQTGSVKFVHSSNIIPPNYSDYTVDKVKMGCDVVCMDSSGTVFRVK